MDNSQVWLVDRQGQVDTQKRTDKEIDSLLDAECELTASLKSNFENIFN